MKSLKKLIEIEELNYYLDEVFVRDHECDEEFQDALNILSKQDGLLTTEEL